MRRTRRCAPARAAARRARIGRALRRRRRQVQHRSRPARPGGRASRLGRGRRRAAARRPPAVPARVRRSRSAPGRAAARAAARSTRSPTSPQPTISSVGRRWRVGEAGIGARPNRAQCRRRRLAMTFNVTVQPAGRTLRCRARRTDPRRRHPRRHRPALRLQGRRLRLVQEPPARGPRHPRRPPAASAHGGRGRSSGLILTCCATPQTDCVIEARTVAGAGEYPVQKMPARVRQHGARRARRGDA